MDDKPDAPWEYSGPLTLTLTCSRVVMVHARDENPLTEIVLREPNVGELAAYKAELIRTRGNDYAAGAVMIAMNANLSPAQAKKISIRDYDLATSFLAGFTTQPDPGAETAAPYDGPITITIICTYDKTDDDHVKELILDEPTLGEFLAYEETNIATKGNEFESGAMLLWNNGKKGNAKLTLKQVKNLSARDFKTGTQFLTGFIRPLPTSGAN